MVSNKQINNCIVELISKRGFRLLAIADFLSHHENDPELFTRPILGELMSQAIQLEELLDSYGARNNRKWYAFRALMATIKLFSDVSYEILHIQHAMDSYRLLPIKEDFSGGLQKMLDFTESILYRALSKLLSESKKLGLEYGNKHIDKNKYKEELPQGRLAHDFVTFKAASTAETVVMLSTAFLNLADESELIHLARKTDLDECIEYVPDSIREEYFRQYELKYHNLQSLYDTHVSESQAENLDTDLPVLRGHISLVFHLLRIATCLAHYYERHLCSHTDETLLRLDTIVNPRELLQMLVNHTLTYTSSHLSSAQRLCQEMLKRYSEQDEIEVFAPVYRGFHVRPSTLISKIVLHYGCQIELKLDDESYNASRPLEIFRMNEKINAIKRTWIKNEIASMQLCDKSTQENISSYISHLIFQLAEQEKIIVYEHPLEIPKDFIGEDETLFKQVSDTLAHLQATGKIDIKMNIKVKVIGDKRVLGDIKILVENGYGEDCFGNNITLPKQLTYLRR